MAGFPHWRYDPNFDTGEITQLTARRGRIDFQMTPGTDEGAASGMYVGEWSYNSDNYIALYFSANNTLKLEFKDSNATVTSDTWDCTGALAHDGTNYQVRIEYDKTYMRLDVDGVNKIDISCEPSWRHNSVPFKYALGTDIDGNNGYTSTTYSTMDDSCYWYA